MPQPRLPVEDFPKLRDFVPTPELKWDVSELKRTRTFSSGKYKQAVCTVLEDLLAQLSADCRHIDLHGRTLKPHSQPQRLLTDTLRVYRASPRGSVVHNGSIVIPNNAVLLLDGQGVCFRHVTFSGGALVCAGADFAGAFHRCAFTACQLLAVHGANITLRTCTFHRCLHGIVASGAGSAATMHRCRFQACRAALCAERGARLAMHASLVAKSDTAAAVSGPGTHAVIVDSDIRWKQHCGGAADMGFCGVVVHGGAVCVLRRCAIRQYHTAATAIDRGSQLELLECAVNACTEGVSCSGHAFTVLRQVYMRDAAGQRAQSTRGVAGVVSGPLTPHIGREADGGGRVQMERCTLPRAPCLAVQVLTGSSASMLLCAARGVERGAAVGIEPTADAAVRPSKLVAQRCEMHLSAAGFMVGAGASVVLRQCDLSSSSFAIETSGAACVSAVDTRISGMHADTLTGPISVAGGAVLRMLRCEICDSLSGIQVDAESSVCMTDSAVCVLQPSDGAPTRGVSVFGGSVDITRCEFTVQPCEAMPTRLEGDTLAGCLAVFALEAVRVVVSGCTFRGCPVFAQEAGAEVALRDCSFEDMHSETFSGVNAAGGSRLLIERCQFSRSARCVHAEAAFCNLNKCTFGPAVSGVAIRGDDDSMLYVSESRFEDCQTGVQGRMQTMVHVLDCEMVGVLVGLNMSGGGGMLAAERVSITAIENGHAALFTNGDADYPARVVLHDCAISGGRFGAAFMGCCMDGGMHRCNVRAGVAGVRLVGGAELVLQECQIDCCKWGLLAGEGDELIDSRCLFCPQRGKEGFRHAWAASQGTAERTDSAARCMHDGAVAKLDVRNVEVSGCSVAAVAVGPWGQVSARGLHVSGSECGIQLQQIFERSTFADCTVTAGDGEEGVQSSKLVEYGVTVACSVPEGIQLIRNAAAACD